MSMDDVEPFFSEVGEQMPQCHQISQGADPALHPHGLDGNPRPFDLWHPPPVAADSGDLIPPFLQVQQLI